MRFSSAAQVVLFGFTFVACDHGDSAPDSAPPGVTGLTDLAVADQAMTLVDGAAGDGDVLQPQACMTHYLSPSSYLNGFADPDWYVDNIPFLDVPDALTNSHIGPVYYYRFSTLKRALRYTDPTNGYVFLEFLEPPGYAARFGAISAAAGHHLYEARWLHDSRYGDDYLNYWLKGSGQAGIREYSFWVADSAWARYQVSGDGDFVKSLLTPLEVNYNAWADHFDTKLGLYWQVPVWDAMEYMADTYSSQNPDGDAYHGGPGYRPTINAYQFADARAIAGIARLSGDATTAASYDARAASLVTAMQTNLWSLDLHFFVHKYRDGAGALFLGREEMGFVPWQFDMPMAGYETAWQDTIMNPASFYTKYGPRTVEKSNAYYLAPYSRGQCCHWNGPLWPYSTTQTLVGMANLLNNHQQSFVTRSDYFQLLESFASSQYKNGVPYVAEALDPDDTTGAPIWTYDAAAHSEHYNHSGFVDPVITGLIGLRPSETDQVKVNPQTPPQWDHFMLENVRYHGHYLTIIWDADGTHYNAGKGFTIMQDCAVLLQQPTLGPIQATMAHAIPPAKTIRLNNLFSNAAGNPYPKASASYTFSVDNIDQINDGIVLYDRSVGGSPNDANVHNRWTNYSSPNASDWIEVDLGAPATLGELTIHAYSDGKGVTAPLGYRIETSLDGTTFTAVTNLVKTPATPAAGPNVARFDAVSARYARVTFQVSDQCAKGLGCAGVTELEAWTAP